MRIPADYADMKFVDYSHHHGKELMQVTHPEELAEIADILISLYPFPHGKAKNLTPKKYVSNAFWKRGWEREVKIPLGTGKLDYCDIGKNRIFIEQEYSRFEMFFRDFFRFLLLYDETT
jgi:hypothetical protein